MKNEKEKFIKKYYMLLTLVLLIYFLGAIGLNLVGVISLKNSLITFLLITFIYYLIVKNLLSKYYKNKIYELDPDLKQKADSKSKAKKEQLKQMAPKMKFKSKWYKNSTFIYIVILFLIVILYNIFN
ncbi:MAG: hypothetical protein FH751_01440 [Firmicutes bacterium]|nr:hypothetical protein [Bacillota bacterium]